MAREGQSGEGLLRQTRAVGSMASGAGDWGWEGVAEAGGGEVGKDAALCGWWGAVV